MDRAAARDDAGEPARRHRDVAQQHARVHREVIDPLLGLLDERVAIDLPRQILGTSADLLERLVDRDRADRHRRVAEDPLARLVNVAAGRQIHHRVGAPERRPAELVHFLLDRRRHGGIADVRVDLDGEVPADDHRLELGVVDVGRDDRAPARDLRPHELGIEALADRDELHLRRDDALARVVQLGDRRGCVPRRRGRPTGSRSFGSPPRDVVPLRTARVVHAQRLAVGQRDLAHRDAHAAPLDVDLAGTGKRGREIRGLQRRKRGAHSHGYPENDYNTR